MARKSPQEKKKLSYKKDRRNRYGENTKSSRKTIPRRKAGENRRYRRALRRGLAEAEFGVAVPASAARIRKSGWRKMPDTPLNRAIERQRAKRDELKGRKSRRSA